MIKNNTDLLIAFENLVRDIFPAQDKQFCKMFAHRLVNFTYEWDKNYGTCEANIKKEQERIIRWIRREVKKFEQ